MILYTCSFTPSLHTCRCERRRAAAAGTAPSRPSLLARLAAKYQGGVDHTGGGPREVKTTGGGLREVKDAGGGQRDVKNTGGGEAQRLAARLVAAYHRAQVRDSQQYHNTRRVLG